MAVVPWLRAQVDEDERVAKAATQGAWRCGGIADHLVDEVIYGTSPYAHPGPGGDKIVQVANLETAWSAAANAEHITRHDPDRVLREVETKRRILDAYAKALERRKQHPGDVGSAADVLVMLRVITLLAAAYADRPGYQEEWRR